MKNEILTITFLFLIICVGYSQTEKGRFYIAGNTTALFNKAKNKPDIKLENHQTVWGDVESYDFSEDVKIYDFSSSVGYFIKDEFMIGLSALLSYNKSDSKEETIYNTWRVTANQDLIFRKNEMILNTKEQSFVFSPFVKYFININSYKTFKMFCVASTGLGKSFNEKTETETSSEFIILDNMETPVEGTYGSNLTSYNSSWSKTESYVISYKLGTGLSYFLNQYLSIDFTIDYFINQTASTFDSLWTKNKYSIKGLRSGVGISVYL